MLDKFYEKEKNELEPITNLEKMIVFDIFICNETKYKKEILQFISTLEKEENINLTVFYNNLKTLTIENEDLNKKEKLKDKLNHGTTIAYYLSSFDKINLIGKCSKYDLFHELFHVASSKYLYRKRLVCSGIMQYSTDGSINVGRYINEGYTELLCDRFFKNFNSECYLDEKKIASALEELVGKENMYNYYFNIDIEGLIKNLKKYSNELNILVFLTSSNKYILRRFLKNCYIKKTYKELLNKEITQEEFENKNIEYLKKLGFEEIVPNDFYKKTKKIKALKI